jgi:hypothetical protein
MLDSAPDLSASRWAPHNRGRPPSSYLNSNEPLSTQTTKAPSGQHSSPTKSRSTTADQRSPVRSQNLTPAQQRQHAYTLYSRLFSRLKWRASLLLTAHTFALSPESHGIGLSPADADAQFRIDFFEFYVLLERTLLHLLNSVGVQVSAAYNPTSDSTRPYTTSSTTQKAQHTPKQGLHYAPPNPPISKSPQPALIGDSRTLLRKHAFHQNLLTALSTSLSNPIYSFLGTGQVYQYIALAKDLRNGWKDSNIAQPTATSDHLPHSHTYAGQTNGDPDEQHLLQERLRRRYAELLKDLQIDEMLRLVLGAVEAAGGVAEREVESFAEAESAAQKMEGRRVSVDMTDVVQQGERPWESMGVGAGWEGDEMEFD